MDRLMRAEATQRKLRKHVRKHKKAAREARWDTDEAYPHWEPSRLRWNGSISRELPLKRQELMIRLCWQDYGSS